MKSKSKGGQPPTTNNYGEQTIYNAPTPTTHSQIESSHSALNDAQIFADLGELFGGDKIRRMKFQIINEAAVLQLMLTDDENSNHWIKFWGRNPSMGVQEINVSVQSGNRMLEKLFLVWGFYVLPSVKFPCNLPAPNLSPSTFPPEFFTRCFQQCIIQKDLKRAEYFLGKGADPKQPIVDLEYYKSTRQSSSILDVTGKTSLHHVALTGDWEGWQFLRSHGVNDLNAVSVNGNRTLFFDLFQTTAGLLEDKLKILQDALKDPSQVRLDIQSDPKKNTALHSLILLRNYNELAEILKIFFKGNPDIRIKNAEGEDVIDLCVNNDFEYCAELLENYDKNRKSMSTSSSSSSNHVASSNVSSDVNGEISRLRSENDFSKIKEHLNNDAELNQLIYQLKKL